MWISGFAFRLFSINFNHSISFTLSLFCYPLFTFKTFENENFYLVLINKRVPFLIPSNLAICDIDGLRTN